MQFSLRFKLGLTLFVAVATFLGVDHVLKRIAFEAPFAELESSHAKLRATEVKGSLDTLCREMSRMARQMDAMRVQEAHDGEEVAPLYVSDLHFVVQRSGDVTEAHFRHPDTGAPITSTEFPEAGFPASHSILSLWRQHTLAEGVVETEYGFVALGCAQRGSGDTKELVIVGTLLTPASLSTSVGAGVQVISLASAQQGELTDDHRASIGSGLPTIVSTESRETHVYSSLPDLRGLPTMAIRAPLIPGVWKELQRHELLSAAAISIIFPLVLLVLLQAIVTGPLRRLTSLASEIGASDDPTLRVRMDRKDEIGILSSTFDSMLDKIEQSRIAQARTARVTGRSEVAVGVMHNVGNMVNSIHVAAAEAHDRASALKMDELRAVLGALKSHEGELDDYMKNDPQGASLLDFFEALLPDLEATADAAQRETDAVLQSVDQIGKLVHSLHATETPTGIFDRMDLIDEINSAADFALEIARQPESIRLERAYSGQVMVSADRQRIREVLLTILSNALEASLDAAAGERVVRIAVNAADKHSVEILVSDSGGGVPAARKAEIFEMGFTTKADGSGLGLHLASVAATEMGGHVGLEAESPLPGATFSFTFPRDGSDRKAPAPAGGATGDPLAS